ncbi:uncharacterized protein EV154DRAFT_602299 [Mucor mucedo]|uniref:uncharacterized protein n=1 Tax=Mucor mucedo TaxID=29922 RepID=UPI00221FFA7C|nr:uncharacterized protein EV154DRAFT_602299 [Mucor mucedo]KAI7891586.1 hypothetical protein EV154DRAFT_602299 [Mucor mucedo]
MLRFNNPSVQNLPGPSKTIHAMNPRFQDISNHDSFPSISDTKQLVIMTHGFRPRKLKRTLRLIKIVIKNTLYTWQSIETVIQEIKLTKDEYANQAFTILRSMSSLSAKFLLQLMQQEASTNGSRPLSPLKSKWSAICAAFRHRNDRLNPTGTVPIENWFYHDALENPTSEMLTVKPTIVYQ